MKKSYVSIDIAKLILSFVVVAIHVDPLGAQYSHLRFPLVRIAVPLFFIMSGFLFFVHLPENDQIQACRSRLLSFVKRNLQLYFSWFLLLIPITVYRSNYMTKSPLYIAGDLIKGFFFGSTFSASWYITATVICVLIVYLLRRHLPNAVIITLGGVLYALCVAASNYYGALEPDGLVISLIGLYPESIYVGFPAGLFWIAVGKAFADAQKKRTSPPASGNRGRVLILAIAAAALFCVLFGEHHLIEVLGSSRRNDCYFALMPLCPVLFYLILSWKAECSHSITIRHMSTVIYCSHVAAGTVIGFVLRKLGVATDAASVSLCVYIATAASCAVLSLLIDKLSEKKHLGWLGYFH